MPHYDRHTDVAGATDLPADKAGSGPDVEAMEDAAEALREAEIDAVQPAPEPDSIDPTELDYMNIDDLRGLARQLDVPDRASITDKDELIAAIRQLIEPRRKHRK